MLAPISVTLSGLRSAYRATLQVRRSSYRVLFCWEGKRYTYTLGKVGKREAELAAANIDRLLLRVDQNLLAVPAGANVVLFFKNDGRVPEEETPAPLAITFCALRDRYLAAHGTWRWKPARSARSSCI